MIEDGSTGLLCDCKDAHGMSDAIRQVLSATDAERVAMGRAGNARLNSRYGRNAIVAAYLDLYSDLLTRRQD